MNSPYLCPKCRSNRTRFAILEQVPLYVKLEPFSGQVVAETGSAQELDPFQVPYQGTTRRVQCGVCGLLEDEKAFIATARNHPIHPS